MTVAKTIDIEILKVYTYQITMTNFENGLKFFFTKYNNIQKVFAEYDL